MLWIGKTTVKKPRRSPRTTAPLPESSKPSSSSSEFLLSPRSVKAKAEKILLESSTPESVFPEKIKNIEAAITHTAITGVYTLKTVIEKYALTKKCTKIAETPKKQKMRPYILLLIRSRDMARKFSFLGTRESV